MYVHFDALTPIDKNGMTPKDNVVENSKRKNTLDSYTPPLDSINIEKKN